MLYHHKDSLGGNWLEVPLETLEQAEINVTSNSKYDPKTETAYLCREDEERFLRNYPVDEIDRIASERSFIRNLDAFKVVR